MADKKFSFSIPLGITIILLAFFLLFRGAISQLISGGDCLDMQFFGSKINTCQEAVAADVLKEEQEEIASFVKFLRNAVDSLQDENSSLEIQVGSLKKQLYEMENGVDTTVQGTMVLSHNSVFTEEQEALYQKYSDPTLSESSQ